MSAEPEDRPLTLLGKASSINVRKVAWTCAELALPVAHEAWGSGAQSTDAPGFLALNPNGLVPVLRDGGFVLWESNTICRYLAARAARHDLLPADPAGRAQVEQWMDWQATELNNAWRYAFMARVRQSPAHADPHAIAASEQAWNRHMAILDARLQHTGAHVAGESFTLADIVIGLSVNRWFCTPIQRSVLPAVAAYADRLRLRPACLVHAMNGLP